MRISEVKRKTAETDISLKLNLDGNGRADIKSGNGFFDHMLTLFAAQSLCDLKLSCKGDVDVDYHHSVEDIGIVLGQAFSEALGDKSGIARYGSCYLPMDEALVLVALDFSGRAYLAYDLEIPVERIGDFPSELVEEFLTAFTRTVGLTLHAKKIAGKNGHHIVEACFKGLGRAVRAAISDDPRLQGAIPSTKGVL